MTSLLILSMEPSVSVYEDALFALLGALRDVTQACAQTAVRHNKRQVRFDMSACELPKKVGVLDYLHK